MTEEQILDFFIRLEGSEGCNFREKIPGDSKSITWICKGGIDKSLSKKILTNMGIGKEDQDSFLSQAHEYGGHCDCEIIFNAKEYFLKDKGFHA